MFGTQCLLVDTQGTHLGVLVPSKLGVVDLRTLNDWLGHLCKNTWPDDSTRLGLG